jgi:G3E family GTPase
LADDGFDAVSFEIDRPFAAEKFQRFLEALPSDVFRAKGVLWIKGSDKRHLFHLVGQRFTLDEAPGAGPAVNRLVLIGRNLDPARLCAELEACVT